MTATSIGRRPGHPGAAAEQLLFIGIYGFGFALLLGRRSFDPALYTVALALAGLIWARAARFRPSLPVQAMLGFGLVFLIQGWAVADGPISGGFHRALGWAILLAMAVPLLPARFAGRFGHRAALGALLALYVAVQSCVYQLYRHGVIPSPDSESVALFSNMHYLAQYAAMTLPVLFYLTLEARPPWRWIVGAALMGDFWLLLQSHSRPGYMALVAAALVTVPFLAGRFRLAALAVIVGLPAVLYFSGAFGFAARIDDFFIHIAEEERAAVWAESWLLQRGSTPLQWVFGHGLGQFFQDYQAVSSFHRLGKDHSSPHNHVLDLLYSHGVVGVILFIAAYGLLYARLAGATLGATDPGRRRVGVLLISVTTAHLVLGFFTIPFFSRHNILPFGLILGADLWGLRWLAENGRARPAASLP